MIAGGVVGIMCVIFLAAFSLNAYTQIRSTGLYILPADFIGILNLVFGGSVAVLSIGGIVATRANQEKQIEKKGTDDAKSS